MKLNKYFFTVLIVGILLLSGCTTQNNAEQSELVTINGVTQQTKDGYYVGEYVLPFESIEKFNPDYREENYAGKNIEITGYIQEIEDPCENESGEIVQCREGSYKVVHDIKSIKILQNTNP